MGDDGFLDIGLPDAHHAGTVRRNTGWIDQTRMDRKGAGRGRQVAAVAGPIDESRINRHLAIQVVHVMLGHGALGQDHALAGARCRATHAVDMGGIGIGAADHPQKQLVARGAWHLAALRQVLQTEEHALAGTATDIGGGNLDLGNMGHE